MLIESAAFNQHISDLKKGLEGALSLVYKNPVEIIIKVKGIEADEPTIRKFIITSFAVSWEDICKPTRGIEAIVVARHSYCFLMYYFIKISHDSIGKIINRNHVSVINSCNVIIGLLDVKDKYFTNKLHPFIQNYEQLRPFKK